MRSILYSIPIEWFEIRQRFHYLAESLAPHHDLTLLAPRSHRRLVREKPVHEWLTPWTTDPLGPQSRVHSVATLPFYRSRPQLVTLQWKTQPARLAKAARSTHAEYDVLWLADPSQAALADLVPHRKLVYECVDDHAGFWADESLKSRLIAMEVALARRADLVITTSRSLTERFSALNANVAWIGNGTHVDYFAEVGRSPQSFPIPADLAALKGPVIGFYGALGHWVDLALVAELARRRPEWTFLLIGPAFTPTDVLDGLPNVHMTGPKPFEELRGYLTHVPVWTIPFKLDAMTRAVDPLKVYEYLAADRQVVTTPLPELDTLLPHLTYADSPEAWDAALAAALVAPPRTPAAHDDLFEKLGARDWNGLAKRVEQEIEALFTPNARSLEPEGSR